MRVLVAVAVSCLFACSSTPSMDDGGSGGGGSTGGGGGSTGGGDGGGATFDPCPQLPAPTGAVVTVTTASGLIAALQGVAPNTTILLEDGTYSFASGQYVYVGARGVTVRGKSNDATKVILDANYATGFGQSIVTLAADDVTLADVTVQRAYDHPIHVQPAFSSPEPLTGVRIYRVRVIDPGQQGIKVNPDEPGFLNVIDDGLIACSAIVLTSTGRAQVRDNCYTGGVDLHAARGWTIRDNHIEGFWCPQGLSEHAIHCWKGCRDITVERNVLVNNARGVGFGLGTGTAGRSYPDNPCPGVTNAGAVGGVIRNNVVSVTDGPLQASGAGFDTGIALELACGDVQVLHNTVVSSLVPASSSIEWRFTGTTATVKNNLSSGRLLQRDGAMATQAGNISNATSALFANSSQHDLHLVPGAAAIDQGAALPAGACDRDLDGQARLAARDVGADEVP
ncbi:MAG: right-handed parallel beta-helix repeat-containing protein [Myxococcales bacterium]|nr:right-handed parallel beta-helix repeat-containing protein [Myxococcales bacterium]